MSEQPKPRAEDMMQLSELPMLTDESQAALNDVLEALVAAIEAKTGKKVESFRVLRYHEPPDDEREEGAGKEKGGF